jgi:transaldolase
VKLFADGADLPGILEMAAKPNIAGFTTNPTLMRKAGIADYAAFAREVLQHITDRPISFEVFSDEFDEMERQANAIASWGDNVYVKIPVTNTRAESSVPLVRRLAAAGVKLNVTALMTNEQVRDTAAALNPTVPAYISLFAGRIADTGRDPVPMVVEAVRHLRTTPAYELIWASPRELLNVFQADASGCHIITAQMFRDDAVAAGFTL